MRTLAMLIGLAAMSCPVSAVETIQLLDARDLAGWTFDLEEDTDPMSVWSVEDGILICKGKPAGVIRTKDDYGNYDLRLEWRWAPDTDGGNCGVLVHCSSPRELGIWPKSIEVQLGKGNAGDFWMIGETIEVPAERMPEKGRRILNLTDGSEKRLGEWNTMRIRCEDRRITVWVNGDTVNEGSNCSVSRGAISLQSEGAEIHFRRVELQPLE